MNISLTVTLDIHLIITLLSTYYLFRLFDTVIKFSTLSYVLLQLENFFVKRSNSFTDMLFMDVLISSYTSTWSGAFMAEGQHGDPITFFLHRTLPSLLPCLVTQNRSR